MQTSTLFRGCLGMLTERYLQQKKMKTLSLLLVSFLLALQVPAQCNGFYFLQANKTVEMSMSNARGKSTGKIVYKTGKITVAGGITSSTLKQEVFDEKGKLLQSGENKIQCNGKTMMVDIKSFVNNQQDKNRKIEMKGNDVYIEYPSSIETGISLPDGNASIQSISGSVITEMEINITERKVIAKESITTAAGTWECFKITYSLQIKSFVGGLAIPMRFNCTEWFAPGFGIVKSSSRFGESVITSVL